MMRLINIAFSMVVVIATALLMSCSNESDTRLTTQQSTIEKFLQGSHQPRLIPESKINESLDNEPKYYTQWGLDIFRYITNMYDEGRDQRPIVERDDKISMTYTAYVFTSSTPTTNDIFATNDPKTISTLKSEGVNTEYEWSSEPIVVKIGSDDILASLSTALDGCHEGDKVEVYLTFEAAYGKHYVGKVPSYSAQMWEITINEIIK